MVVPLVLPWKWFAASSKVFAPLATRDLTPEKWFRAMPGLEVSSEIGHTGEVFEASEPVAVVPAIGEYRSDGVWNLLRR